jgi:ankyrin repeat protein
MFRDRSREHDALNTSIEETSAVDIEEESETLSLSFSFDNTALLSTDVLLPTLLTAGTPNQEGKHLLENLEQYLQKQWKSVDDVAEAMNMRKLHLKIRIDSIRQGNTPTTNFVRQMARAIGCTMEELLTAPAIVESLPEKSKLLHIVMSRLGWSIDKVSATTGMTQQRLLAVVNQGVGHFTQEELTQLLNLKGVHLHQFVQFIESDLNILEVINTHLNDIPDESDVVFKRKAISYLRQENGLKIAELSHCVGMQPAEFKKYILGQEAGGRISVQPLPAHLKANWKLTLTILKADQLTEADLVLMGRFGLTSPQLLELRNYEKTMRVHVQTHAKLIRFLKKATNLDRYKIFVEVQYQALSQPQKPWNEISSKSVVRAVKRSKVKMTPEHVRNVYMNIVRQLENHWWSLSDLSSKINMQTAELSRRLMKIYSGKIPSIHFVTIIADALDCKPSQLFSPLIETKISLAANKFIDEAKRLGFTQERMALRLEVSEKKLYRIVNLEQGRFDKRQIKRLKRAGMSLPTLAAVAKREVDILGMAKVFATEVAKGEGHSEWQWAREGVAMLMKERNLDVNALSAKTGLPLANLLRCIQPGGSTRLLFNGEWAAITTAFNITQHDLMLIGKFSLSGEQLQELRNFEYFFRGYVSNKQAHRGFASHMSDSELFQLYIGMKHRASLLPDKVCTATIINDVVKTIKPKAPAVARTSKELVENLIINLEREMENQWLTKKEFARRLVPLFAEGEGQTASMTKERVLEMVHKIMNRKVTPSKDMAGKMAKVLHCRASDLLAMPKVSSQQLVNPKTAYRAVERQDFINSAKKYGLSRKEAARILNTTESRLSLIINHGQGAFTTHEIETLIRKRMRPHQLVPFAANDVNLIAITENYLNKMVSKEDWYYQQKGLRLLMVERGFSAQSLSMELQMSKTEVQGLLHLHIKQSDIPAFQNFMSKCNLSEFEQQNLKMIGRLSLSIENLHDLKNFENLLRHCIENQTVKKQIAHAILKSEDSMYKLYIALSKLYPKGTSLSEVSIPAVKVVMNRVLANSKNITITVGKTVKNALPSAIPELSLVTSLPSPVENTVMTSQAVSQINAVSSVTPSIVEVETTIPSIAEMERKITKEEAKHLLTNLKHELDAQWVKKIGFMRQLAEHPLNRSLNVIQLETKFRTLKEGGRCNYSFAKSIAEVLDYSPKKLIETPIISSIQQTAETKAFLDQAKRKNLSRKACALALNCSEAKLFAAINQHQGGLIASEIEFFINNGIKTETLVHFAARNVLIETPSVATPALVNPAGPSQSVVDFAPTSLVVDRQLTKKETKYFVRNFKHELNKQWMSREHLITEMRTQQLAGTNILSGLDNHKQSQRPTFSVIQNVAKVFNCSAAKLIAKPKRVEYLSSGQVFIKEAIRKNISMKECARLFNTSEAALYRAVNLGRGGLEAHEIEYFIHRGMKPHVVATFAAKNVDMIAVTNGRVNAAQQNAYKPRKNEWWSGTPYIEEKCSTVESLAKRLGISLEQAEEQFFTVKTYKLTDPKHPLGKLVEAKVLRPEWQPLFSELSEKYPTHRLEHALSLTRDTNSVRECEQFLQHLVRSGLVEEEVSHRILSSESNTHKLLAGLKQLWANSPAGHINSEAIKRVITRVLTSKPGMISALFVGSIVKSLPLTACEIVADEGVHYYDREALVTAPVNPLNSFVAKLNSHVLKWLFLFPKAVGGAIMTPFDPERAWSFSSVFNLPDDIMENFFQAGGYSKAITDDWRQAGAGLVNLFRAPERLALAPQVVNPSPLLGRETSNWFMNPWAMADQSQAGQDHLSLLHNIIQHVGAQSASFALYLAQDAQIREEMVRRINAARTELSATRFQFSRMQQVFSEELRFLYTESSTLTRPFVPRVAYPGADASAVLFALREGNYPLALNEYASAYFQRVGLTSRFISNLNRGSIFLTALSASAVGYNIAVSENRTETAINEVPPLVSGIAGSAVGAGVGELIATPICGIFGPYAPLCAVGIIIPSMIVGGIGGTEAGNHLSNTLRESNPRNQQGNSTDSNNSISGFSPGFGNTSPMDNWLASPWHVPTATTPPQTLLTTSYQPLITATPTSPPIASPQPLVGQPILPASGFSTPSQPSVTQSLDPWLVDPWTMPSQPAPQRTVQPVNPPPASSPRINPAPLPVQSTPRQTSLLASHYLYQPINSPSFFRNPLFNTNNSFTASNDWLKNSSFKTWLQPNLPSFSQVYNPISFFVRSEADSLLNISHKYRYANSSVERAIKRALADEYYRDGTFHDAHCEAKRMLGLDGFYFSEFESALRSLGLVRTYNMIHRYDRVRELYGYRGEIGGVAASVGIIEGMANSRDEVLLQDPIICIKSEDKTQPFKNEELPQITREITDLVFNGPETNPFVSIHFADLNGTMCLVLNPRLQKTIVGETIWILDYFMKCFLNGGTYDVDTLLHWHELKNADREYLKRLVVDLKKMFKEHKQSYLSSHEQKAKMGLDNSPDQPAPSVDDSYAKYKHKHMTSFRIIAEMKSVKKEGNIFLFEPDFHVEYTIDLEPDHAEYLEKHLHDHHKYPDDYLALKRLYEKLCIDIKEQMTKLPLFRDYFKKLEVIISLYYYLQTQKSLGMKPALSQKDSIHSHTAPKSLPPIPVRYYRYFPLQITLGKLLLELGPENCKQIDQMILTGIEGKTIRFPQDFKKMCHGAFESLVKKQMPQESEESVKEYIQDKGAELALIMERLIKNSAVNNKLSLNKLLKEQIVKFELPIQGEVVEALPTVREKMAVLQRSIEDKRIADKEKGLHTDFMTLMEERFNVKALIKMLADLDDQLQKAAKEKERNDLAGKKDLSEQRENVVSVLATNQLKLEAVVKAWQQAIVNKNLIQKYQLFIPQVDLMIAEKEKDLAAKKLEVNASRDAMLARVIADDSLKLEQEAEKIIAEELKKNNLTKADSSKPNVKEYLAKMTAEMNRVKAERIAQFKGRCDALKKQDKEDFAELDKELAEQKIRAKEYKAIFLNLIKVEQAQLNPSLVKSSDSLRAEDKNKANALAILADLQNQVEHGTQVILKNTQLAEKNLFQFFPASTLEIGDGEYYKEVGDNFKWYGGCHMQLDSIQLQALPMGKQMTAAMMANMHHVAAETFASIKVGNQYYSAFTIPVSPEPSYDLLDNVDLKAALRSPVVAKNPMQKSHITSLTEKWVECIIGEQSIALSDRILTAQDPNGQTIMHYCASFASAALLQRLCGIKTSAFEIPDHLGHLPLHVAAIHGNADALNYYLTKMSHLINAQTHSGANAIILAAQNGKSDAVQKLVTMGADVNHRLSNGMGALYLAIQNDHPDTAVCLLKSSPTIQVNVSLFKGSTPLLLAIQLEQTAVVKELIARGADIAYKRCSDGYTSLHVAAEQGLVTISQAILETGKIDVNVALPSGKTALHLAAIKGHLDLIRELKKANAHCDALTVTGETPLMVAITHGQTAAALFLARHTKINQCNQEGQTASLLAAMYNQFVVADKLIKRGEDYLKLDKHKLDYIYYLLKYGQYNRFCTLLQKRKIVAEGVYNGLSTLDVAAQYGHPMLMRLLEKRKRRFTLHQTTGWELIHYAVKADDISFVENWLNEKKDDSYPVQMGVDAGKSLAYIAAENAALICLQLLLNKKENRQKISPEITKNQPPLLYAAIQNGRKKVIEIVLKYDDDNINQLLDREGNSALHIAVKLGLLQLIEFLKRCGSNFSLKNHDNLTAFHLAIENDDKEMLQVLLDCVEPNQWPVDLLAYAISMGKNACQKTLNAAQEKQQIAFEESSITALQNACKSGNLERVVALLRQKINVNIQTNEGYVLHQAIKAGSVEIVTELLQSGADPLLEQDKLNAYAIAVKYQQIRIIQLMQQLNVANLDYTKYCRLTNFNPYVEQALKGQYDLYETTKKQLLQAMDDVDDIRFKKLLLQFPINQSLITDSCFTQPLLHWAIFKKADWAICLLAEAGANPLTKDSRGAGIMHKLALSTPEDGKWQLMIINQYFSEYKEKLLADETTTGNHVFECAKLVNNSWLYSALIDAGFSSNYKTRNDETLLHIMVRQGEAASVKAILDQKQCDVNAVNKRQETPLMLAAETGNSIIFQLLLDYGANLYHRNIEGCSVLHRALLHNHEAIALQLLAFTNLAADQTRYGITPLMYAAKNGMLSIVRILCESGIPLQQHNQDGMNALHIAAIYNQCDVIRYLVAQGFAVNALQKEQVNRFNHFKSTALHLAGANGNDDAFLTLVELGADLDHKDLLGRTAIEVALSANNKNMTQLICKLAIFERPASRGSLFLAAARGNNTFMLTELLLADKNLINYCGQDGRNALHIASLRGAGAAAALLIAQGIQVNALAKNRFSVLHDAARSGSVSLLKLLCRQKMDLNVTNNKLQTPLHLACRRGHYAGALQLLKAGADHQLLNQKGMNATHLALKSGAMEIIRLLAAFGDLTLSKNLPKTLQSEYQKHKWQISNIVQTCQRGIKLKANAIQMAILLNQNDALQILCEKYPEQIHEQNNQGLTALELAAAEDNVAAKSILLACESLSASCLESTKKYI